MISFFYILGTSDSSDRNKPSNDTALKKEHQISWSKSNPTSPLKLSQKNSSFNFKKIPDLKKRKPVQESEEAMPKSSAKNSAEIDREDTESIIISNQQLKKFENKKSSILKRGSNNNLVSRESETSLKPLNDLPDGILNFDSENEQYTLEGDIDGLMSVSEPSTRVHTTHPSQHPTEPEPEDSEDEAVIDDFSEKKDNQARDNDVIDTRIPDSGPETTDEVNDHVEENTVPIREDNPNHLVEDQKDTDKHESPPENDNGGIEETDGDLSANAREISDEESGPEDNDSTEGGKTQEIENAQSDIEKNLVVENDLHVSDAEEEAPELETQSMRENSELRDGGSIARNDKPILLDKEEAMSVALTSNNFDSTIDKIVADVTTKSVINKEKNHDSIDFSAFNWKPNVDFFNFGNGEKEQMSVNIFNFGKGTPPPPQIIKKKGVLSGDRPRSKSLQRALAKRSGYN